MEYRITKTQIENDLLYETLKALYEGMKALGLPLYIVGGTARDFSRAILGTDKPARVTTDLDVAIAIRDWSAFDKICAELEKRQFMRLMPFLSVAWQIMKLLVGRQTVILRCRSNALTM